MPHRLPKYSLLKFERDYEFEMISFEELYKKDLERKVLFSNHRTSFYHIIWFESKNSVHYINDKKLLLEPNSILFINKDVILRFSEEKCSGKVILFTDSFFSNTKANIKYMDACSLFEEDYALIKPRSEEYIRLLESYYSFMKREMDEHIGREVAVVRNLLFNVLLLSEREFVKKKNYMDNTDSFPLYVQFRILVETFYKEHKKVSYYATRLDISEKTLNTIIIENYGISPKEFINEKVFVEAKRMLKYTSLSVKEISYYLNFEPVYFGKFFRKLSGITPVKYRNSD